MERARLVKRTRLVKRARLGAVRARLMLVRARLAEIVVRLTMPLLSASAQARAQEHARRNSGNVVGARSEAGMGWDGMGGDVRGLRRLCQYMARPYNRECVSCGISGLWNFGLRNFVYMCDSVRVAYVSACLVCVCCPLLSFSIRCA